MSALNSISRPFTLLAAMAAITLLSAPATASNPGLLEEVIYEFNEDLYLPGSPQVIADLGIGPARLVELTWEDVVIETYNNIGVPNWANEAWMGFRAVDSAGTAFDVLTQPFPDTFESGVVGPTSGSLAVDLLELFSDAEGTVDLLVASNWDDGSGQPAGAFLSGRLILRYQSLVPAPGTLALVGLCLIARRRRR
ncbi:MAG: hypothetical protein MK101_08605 [Phycisphaerales bacterium]|nr:hypothetical protein [Phycisphaerales bacterium]